MVFHEKSPLMLAVIVTRRSITNPKVLGRPDEPPTHEAVPFARPRRSTHQSTRPKLIATARNADAEQQQRARQDRLRFDSRFER